MREAAETIGSHRGRRANAARVVLCALVLVAALVAIPASSSALSQRGHVLLGPIGKEGTGAGELKEPQGVAVNEATGDIYVADSGNARLDRFNSKGEFISASGFGVANGEHKFQVCTTTCQAGLPAKARGQMFNAKTIAVDNSTNPSDPSKGDVYVEIPEFETELKGKEVVHEFGAITKFLPNGQLPEKGGQITKFEEEVFNPVTKKFDTFKEEIEEAMNGITVDQNGNLYLYYEELVVKFDDAAQNKTLSVFEAEVEEAPGIAVGAPGHIYLGNVLQAGAPPVISEFLFGLEEPILDDVYDKPTSAATFDHGRNDLVLDNIKSVAVLNAENQLVETLGEGQLTKGTGVAVNTGSEHVYVADAGTGKILDFGPEDPGAPTFGPSSSQNTTGTSTELSGAVNPHGGKETQYSIRVSTGPVPGPESPCASPCVESALTTLGSEGFEEVPVGPVKLEGLTPETKYRYRVFAQNKVGASTLTAESGESFFTTLYAPGSTLPDGRSWEQVSPVNKNGSALQPNPTEGGILQASANGEAITYLGAGAISNSEGNPEPEGNYAPFLSQIYGHWGPTGWSAHDLDVRHEKADGVIPGKGNGYRLFSEDLSLGVFHSIKTSALEEPPLNGLEGQESTPYLRSQSSPCLESPAPTECFTALATSSNAASKFGNAVHFAGGNADLSHDVVESTVALTAQPIPAGSTNLYERSASAPGTFELVSVLPPPSGTPAKAALLGGGALRNVEHAISKDGSRVFFETTGEGGAKTQHLYMRDTSLSKTLQVDLQEPGVTIPATLYKEAPSSYETANFVGATEDGSIVFFTDQWRLTPDSQAAPGQYDLYACRVEEVGGEPKCNLTDLTVSGNAEERAGVQGVVGSGSNSSGTSIYYVANGQLAAGAEQSKCVAGMAANAKQGEEVEEGVELEAKALGRLCNLYVQHFDAGKGTWSKPALITRLSAEDEPDWLSQRPGVGVATRGPMGPFTSRVSPEGDWVSFMSDRNLTGYDARDVSNGRGAEEVYSYGRSAGKLACVSCNRTGARPHGIFDNTFAGEGIGLEIDRPRIWLDRLLSANVPGWSNYELNGALYQSRYLDDQGRVFFNSVEALVPQDTNGKADVYEWEPSGVGGCTPAAETYTEAFSEGGAGCISLISSGKADSPSAFIDASANGNDVFFLTTGKLLKQDEDTSFDVYDAAVCGREGTNPCLPEPAGTKPSCTEIKTCRPAEGEVSGTPTFGVPTSGTPSGSGNTGKSAVLPSKEETKSKSTPPAAKPLTRAQKLAKAMKACKKIKKHSKRVACEKAAKKKYGAKKASAHKSAAHGASRGTR
jgi:DNA-binding beta-propeller fold protein YncE